MSSYTNKIEIKKSSEEFHTFEDKREIIHRRELGDNEVLVLPHFNEDGSEFDLTGCECTLECGEEVIKGKVEGNTVTYERGE